MCEVLDRIEQRGEARGEGVGEARMLMRLMEGTGWTLDEAMDNMRMNPAERARCKELFRSTQA